MTRLTAHKIFLLSTSIFLIVGMVIMVFSEKGDIVIFFSEHRMDWSNILFKNITHLGDGLMLIPLLIITLFVRYYWTLVLVGSSLFTLALSQGLKRTIFNGWPRPIKYFEDTIQLNIVEGVKLHEYFTFPSGHTITAFVVFYLLSLIFTKRTLGFLFFILALFVGISRVYIMQHFFLDIYFGSVLGIFAVIIPKYIIDRFFNKNWLERSKHKSIMGNYE